MKNRDVISTPGGAGISQSRIHLRDRKFLVLDKALLRQMQFMLSTNVSIDGNFLKEKAKTSAEKINNCCMKICSEAVCESIGSVIENHLHNRNIKYDSLLQEVFTSWNGSPVHNTSGFFKVCVKR